MFSSKDLFFTGSSGYRISNSLRFRSSASAYLSRTPGSASNQTTWTWSAWVKRGALGSGEYELFNAGYTSGTTNYMRVMLYQDNLYFDLITSGTLQWRLVSNAVYRDPSAWYHIVAVYDSTNATSTNRARVYVNGSLISYSSASYPTSSQAGLVNSAIVHGISSPAGSAYLDGYLAEVNFIDGQALTPSSFGETDATTGVWKPKAYTGGSYGTNGFYLKFADNSGATATTIGKDSSGNGNNWTPNNISVTAGTTYDSMIDTPTPYITDGVYNVGNYATLNPLAVVTGSTPTLSNGNLTTVTGVAGAGYSMATIALPSSGKYYWETVASSTAGGMLNGIAPYSTTMNAFTGTACSYYSDGTRYVNGVNSAYGSAYTTNTIGVAVDIDSGTVTFYRDNVSQGAITYAGANLFAFVSDGSSGSSSTFDVNFGQRPFTYTPPTGFKALNTFNLPTPTIAAGGNYMAAVLYNGTSASNTVVATSSNSGNNPLALTFQPDLVWIKSRSAATNHELTDAVRGVTKSLVSNSTAVEATDTNGLTAFTSTGFTVGSDSNYNNGTGPATYVAWEWKAGNGTVSNTSGSITSTVSANATAGFSVVTYTGTGANATVGHGLGVAPSMVIVKSRSSVADWMVWHSALAATENVWLNSSAAKNTGNTTAWNSTLPSSSVLSVGTNTSTNASAINFVAYCFAAVAGYSAFGSYTGNGSADGPFVFTGFRPRYILAKRTDTTSDWRIHDTSRATYNVDTVALMPNLSSVEDTGSNNIDVLSNGFKMRDGGAFNTSSGTYIYAAFAETPFAYARAR